MKQLKPLVVTVTLLALVTGSALAQDTVVGTPVGPRTGTLAQTGMGRLIVFTNTEEHQRSEDLYIYPHTPYKIFRMDGTKLRTVDNGHCTWTEEPTMVRLPDGKYYIVAESELEGTVRVPITIVAGRLTEIHLERTRDWNPKVASSRLVRLPNGQPIGFRD